MNNNIQKLLLQSKNPNTGYFDEQKFAELIVKQCCNVVDAQNYYVYSGDVKKLILERFGVTE